MGSRPPSEDLTRLLAEARRGSGEAQEALWPIVYQEMHALAQRLMASEPPGHTLQATALVNETYLRMMGQGTDWKDRRHFYSAAAMAMRRILIDRARRVRGLKAGGALGRVPLQDITIEVDFTTDEMLALDEALNRLRTEDSEAHEIVMLRYFAGLSVAETATAIGVSPSTVDRTWRSARVWLYGQMTGEHGD